MIVGQGHRIEAQLRERAGSERRPIRPSWRRPRVGSRRFFRAEQVHLEVRGREMRVPDGVTNRDEPGIALHATERARQQDIAGERDGDRAGQRNIQRRSVIIPAHPEVAENRNDQRTGDYQDGEGFPQT